MNKKRTPARRDAVVQDLKLHLRRFAIELLVSNFQATEAVGLNSTDLGSLCLLLLHGPSPAGRIAELTGLTTGAVTGVVDRLERGGFVRREVDPHDRRRVIVAADAARAQRVLFPHFSSLKLAASSDLYERYSVAELGVIADFLARLSPQ